MSYSFKLWSHPNKLLKDHITNVFKNGQRLHKKLALSDDLRTVIELCLLLHDFGKASDYFQQYIHAIHHFNTGSISKEELEHTKHTLGKYKAHAHISAIWVFNAIQEQLQNPLMCLLGYVAVLRHHGHLTNLKEMLELSSDTAERLKTISRHSNYEEYSEILKANGYSIHNFSHQALEHTIDTFFNTRHFRRQWKKEISQQLSDEHFIRQSLIFSMLLSADKGECIFDGIVFERDLTKLPPRIVDTYKSTVFKTKNDDALNQLREKVYHSVHKNILTVSKEERFLSINVPTGIGKTLTTLNAALNLLQKRNDLEKIIYCLPFTSVIDQNAQVIEEILNQNNIENSSINLSINHHLAELRYTTGTDDEIDDNKSEFLITQFESKINVTTFYQLLYGIFTGKNNEIKKLHSFANSIIILDEVQSIPSTYWPLIKQVFTLLADALNITFLLVTATLPMIFSEEKREIKELVENKRAIFHSVDRIHLNTKLLHHSLTEDEFLDLLENDITQHPHKSFLIILNTIKASKNIYLALEKNHSNLVYLSTSIPPIERLNRIQKIRSSREPLIVVSTQLVEAGVDIDLDIVYRDIAPLDSIFQSAGRCNRNATHKKGEVKVFSLLDANGKRYASYIYSKADLDTTRNLLTQQELFRESEFYDLANNYFATISQTPKDESLFILEEIKKLNYANAFEPAKHQLAFELIKNLPTYPAYIAFCEEAKQLLQEYDEAVNSEYASPFEKKRSIKNILKKLSRYSVSVPEQHHYNTDSFYYIISQERKDFSYNPATGIEFEQTQGYFI